MLPDDCSSSPDENLKLFAPRFRSAELSTVISSVQKKKYLSCLQQDLDVQGSWGKAGDV